MLNNDNDVYFDIYFQCESSTATWKDLKRLVRTLCTKYSDIATETIDSNYIRSHVFKETDIFLFMYKRSNSVHPTRTTSEIKNYLGFALLSVMTKNKELYIHVMCTIPKCGYGRILLHKIADLAKTIRIDVNHNASCKYIQIKSIDEKENYDDNANDNSSADKIYWITLSSMPETINFYRKMGYTHFEPNIKSQQNYEDPVNITPFAEDVSTLVFGTFNSALQDPRMSGFLNLLIQHRLSLNKKDKDLHSCSVDGFSMAKSVR